MRNSMIIRHSSGKSEHFICPCMDCNADQNKTIQTFYSYEHAISRGWNATKDMKYCDPKEEWVFVCPDCCKEIASNPTKK